MSASSAEHCDLVTPVQNFLSRIVWQLICYDAAGSIIVSKMFDTYRCLDAASVIAAEHPFYDHHEIIKTEVPLH
jgi:hypothetical protein